MLLQAGADLNGMNTEGLGPLQFAIKSKNIILLRLLLDFIPDINSKDCNNFEWALLYYAAYSGNSSIGKILLNAGTDVQIRNRDSDGSTP